MTTRPPRCPSTRSTTRSPVSPRPSWRWASARRSSASWTTPPSTTAWCGRPTRALSAPRSAWPGCRSRPGTGPGPYGRWSPCPRRRSTTRRPGSRPYGPGCANAPPHEPLIDDLTAAADQVSGRCRSFGLDAVRREQLSTEVLGTALDWVLSGSPTACRPPPPGSADRGAARQRAGRARPAFRS